MSGGNTYGEPEPKHTWQQQAQLAAVTIEHNHVERALVPDALRDAYPDLRQWFDNYDDMAIQLYELESTHNLGDDDG